MAQVKLKAELDSKDVNKNLKGMTKGVKGFSKELSGVKGLIAGAFSIGTITTLSRSAIQLGSDISDMATQLSISTDQFQALEFRAIKAGVDVSKMRAVITKLGVTLGQAKAGMSSYVKLFNDMGISSEDFIKMDVPQALEAVAKVVANSAEGSVELSSVWQVLGTRSGPLLREVLLDLAKEGLPGFEKSARSAFGFIEADAIQALDDMNDRLDLTSRGIKGETGKWTVAVVGFVEDSGKALGIASLRFERFGGKLGIKGIFANPFKQLKALFKAVGKGSAAEIGDILIQDEIDKSRAKAKAKADAADRKRKSAERQKLRLQEQADEKAKKALEKLAKIQEKADKKKADAFRQSVKEADTFFKKVDAGQKKLAEVQKGAGISLPIEVADRITRIGGQIGGQVNVGGRLESRRLQIAEKTLEFLRQLPPEIAQELAPLVGVIIE